MPRIVSHDEWVAARTALLVKEKEATNQAGPPERRTSGAADGRGEAYEFDGPVGTVSLLDL